MRKVYVFVEERNSAWGREAVEFTVPDDTSDADVYRALDKARESVQRDVSLINEDTCSEEITMMIMERAAQILGGKESYVDMVEFEYEYDWNYWEENHKED